MKRKWQVGVAVSAVLAASATFVAVGFASDHGDSPMTVADPEMDIADVYAFMRPEGSGPYSPSTHMVVTMTLAPGASATQKFSTEGEYTFRLSRLDAELGDLQQYKISCNARDRDGGTQVVLCNAAGTFASAVVNAAPTGSPSDPIRVWAGVRSDPAFFDKAKFSESVTSHSLKFADPGTNAFQGKNVLAIVVEFDVAKVLNPSGAPVTSNMFAVAADTQRSF